MKSEDVKLPTETEQEKPSLLERVDLGIKPMQEGIFLLELLGFNSRNQPLVKDPEFPESRCATSLVPLSKEDQGRQIAVSRLADSGQLLILGLIANPVITNSEEKRLVLQAKEEVELRCGKASILLKESGKVIIKGTEIVSRSKGSNKIKGASVSIN